LAAGNFCTYGGAAFFIDPWQGKRFQPPLPLGSGSEEHGRLSGVFSAAVLPYNCSWANASFQKGTAMPAAVKIKSGKYGSAIGLLLERGGSFQTRHERTLIVNSDQRKALEKAGLVETNGLKEGSGKAHGQKKDAG
jgi:hypothetical protein